MSKGVEYFVGLVAFMGFAMIGLGVYAFIVWAMPSLFLVRLLVGVAFVAWLYAIVEDIVVEEELI